MKFHFFLQKNLQPPPFKASWVVAWKIALLLRPSFCYCTILLVSIMNRLWVMNFFPKPFEKYILLELQIIITYVNSSQLFKSTIQWITWQILKHFFGTFHRAQILNLLRWGRCLIPINGREEYIIRVSLSYFEPGKSFWFYVYTQRWVGYNPTTEPRPEP